MAEDISLLFFLINQKNPRFSCLPRPARIPGVTDLEHLVRATRSANNREEPRKKITKPMKENSDKKGKIGVFAVQIVFDE